MIKYIKSVPWRVTKRLSYIEEARCLKVNAVFITFILGYSDVPPSAAMNKFVTRTQSELTKFLLRQLAYKLRPK